MDINSKYYEGCGQEGPIRCIFLCEFHPTAGPRITCQVPENYISKDIFDTVSHYIIPKVQLQRCTLTVTLLGSKILGFPVRIDNKKYARNAYYFNLCFVCDAWARTVHLEPLVKKLTEYLLSMELETEWLSRQSLSGDAKALGGLMRQVMQDINCRKMCTLTEWSAYMLPTTGSGTNLARRTGVRNSHGVWEVYPPVTNSPPITVRVGTTTTHLTVVRINSDPAPVKDHQVPVFLFSRQSFVADQWDLTTNQYWNDYKSKLKKMAAALRVSQQRTGGGPSQVREMNDIEKKFLNLLGEDFGQGVPGARVEPFEELLPHIDGFNHVAKIAALTDVEISLVRACVQNLVYYGVVTLVPIFQYCAIYSATPKLRQLTRCAALQRQCQEFCARSPRQLPKVSDVFRMYAAMSYGGTVRDLCRRLKPQELAINERKLVLFGVLEGLIRRVYKYPITLHNDNSSTRSEHSTTRTYNGLVCLDELCCSAGVSAAHLEDQLERDSDVVFIVK